MLSRVFLSLAIVCASLNAQVAIVSSASFRANQPVAAGSYATAFGTFTGVPTTTSNTATLPTTLGGVSLQIEGVSAPLYDVLRRASRGSFNNLAVINFYAACLDINDAATQAQADAGNLTMNGILCWNDNLGSVAGPRGATLQGNIPQAYTLAYAQGQKGNGAGQNIFIADPLQVRPTEFSDPDFAGLFGSPLFRVGAVAAPDDSFFDQTAKFIGGIGDVDWTEEWTSWLNEPDLN
jgi:hypothetical protein